MNRAKLSLDVIKAALAKTNGLCTYCGVRIGFVVEWAWAIDHMLPVSRGGTDEVKNLVGACRPCNSSKGVLTVDEYRIIVMAQQGRIFTDAQIKFWLERGIDLPRVEPIKFLHE